MTEKISDNTTLVCICKNCNKGINKNDAMCGNCNADLTREASKICAVEIRERIVLSEELRIKGKSTDKSHEIKYRCDCDKEDTQHQIEVFRKDGGTDVFHTVSKYGKIIHRHKK